MTKDLMFESWTPSQVKTFFFSSTITKSLVCLDLHPRHKNTFDFLKNAVTWSITTHLNPLTQNWQFIRISDGRGLSPKGTKKVRQLWAVVIKVYAGNMSIWEIFHKTVHVCKVRNKAIHTFPLYCCIWSFEVCLRFLSDWVSLEWSFSGLQTMRDYVSLVPRC